VRLEKTALLLDAFEEYVEREIKNALPWSEILLKELKLPLQTK